MIRLSIGTVYLPDSISSFQRIMCGWITKQVKMETVKVLSTNEELESLRKPSNTASLQILESPTFWAVKADETQNSWRGSCAQDALTIKPFKLFRPSFGILKIKKLSNNAGLPKRTTDGVVGYDLCVSQNCTILEKGKVLVRIGLSISFPESSMPTLLLGQVLALRNSLMWEQEWSIWTIEVKLALLCSTMETKILRSKWETE